MDLSVTCEQKLRVVGGLRVWYLNQICRLFSNSKSINKVTAFLPNTQKFTKPSYSIVLNNSAQCLSSINLGFGASYGSQSQHVTFTF